MSGEGRGRSSSTGSSADCRDWRWARRRSSAAGGRGRSGSVATGRRRGRVGARPIVVRDRGGSARAREWVGSGVATTQWWVCVTTATAVGGRVGVGHWVTRVGTLYVCVCHFDVCPVGVGIARGIR